MDASKSLLDITLKRYSTLLFDAFDTVIEVRRSTLPAHDVDGRRVHSTASAVHERYQSRFGEIPFDRFYRAFSSSFERTERQRLSDDREIPSQRRFALMLELLGHSPSDGPADVLEELAATHMAKLGEALVIAEETLEVLEWCRWDYAVGMVSNFDYAPTVYRALERFGATRLFDHVVVSVETGTRKPSPEIFRHSLRALGARAEETLFIGDQLHLDVRGAHNSGMHVAWLDIGRETWTEDYPEPTYHIRHLRELRGILSASGSPSDAEGPASASQPRPTAGESRILEE